MVFLLSFLEKENFVLCCITRWCFGNAKKHFHQFSWSPTQLLTTETWQIYPPQRPSGLYYYIFHFVWKNIMMKNKLYNFTIVYKRSWLNKVFYEIETCLWNFLLACPRDPRLSGYSANTPSFIYFNIKRPRVNFSKKISTEIQIIWKDC